MEPENLKDLNVFEKLLRGLLMFFAILIILALEYQFFPRFVNYNIAGFLLCFFVWVSYELTRFNKTKK
jgi:hypothetical protein